MGQDGERRALNMRRAGGWRNPSRKRVVKAEGQVRPRAGRLHLRPQASPRKAISLSSCPWAQTSCQDAISSTKRLASVSVWGQVSEVKEAPSDQPLPLPECTDFSSFPLPPSDGSGMNDRSAVTARLWLVAGWPGNALAAN